MVMLRNLHVAAGCLQRGQAPCQEFGTINKSLVAVHDAGWPFRCLSINTGRALHAGAVKG